MINVSEYKPMYSSEIDLEHLRELVETGQTLAVSTMTWEAILDRIEEQDEQLKTMSNMLKQLDHSNEELKKYWLQLEKEVLPNKPTGTLGKGCLPYYAVLSSTIANKFHELMGEHV